MGKAKSRSLNLGKNNQFTRISREDAVKKVVANIRNIEVVNYLTSLFNMSAEELLEAGAQFEDVKAIEGILNA